MEREIRIACNKGPELESKWFCGILCNHLVTSVLFLSLSVCRGLADTKQTGKLNREQFYLAMYLIQQKVTKGIDPPSTLTQDMIPPSERSASAAAVSLVVSPIQPLLHLPAACLLEYFTCICTLRIYVSLLLHVFEMGALLSDFSALQNSFFCFCSFLSCLPELHGPYFFCETRPC